MADIENKNETAVNEAAETKAPAKKSGGKNNIIRIVILVLCIGVFAFSVFKIGSDLVDDNSTGDEYNDLHELAGRDEVNNDTPTIPDDSQNNNESQDPENNNEKDPVEPTDPDPVEPNVPDDSQSSENTETPTTPENPGDSTETPDDNTNVPDNSTETPDNTQTQTPSTDPMNPSSYNDQTAAEAEKDKTQNSIVTVTRPNASLDKTDLSVIHPDNIKLEDIAYLSGIDFKMLKQRNSDTVAWICIPGNDSITGLPVDTAVVQTTDNSYYLSHSFDKSDNVNGWIYADYRNNMSNITSNYNTVIYGHARSYRMFGGLKNLNVTPEWYKNGYNHFIKISTPNEETIWQIFSWHETNVYYNYIQTEFTSAQEFIDFATELQDKNELKGYFSTFEFSENSRIITLSTCKGSNPANRVAVHAVLVARNPLK